MTATDLRRALKALPDETMLTVTAGWLREQLRTGNGEAAAPDPDLTVEEAAEMVGRSPSTVRRWCPEIEGAYRLQGREWRIPRESFAAYVRGPAVE